MSLNKVTTGQVVWRQYRYKMRAYHQVFTSLVVLQLIALVFSFNGTASFGGGGYGLNTNLNAYSGDIILIFTFLWAVMNAIVMTTKTYREDDFLFVTNHTSQHLANILFLATAAVIGGVTATLANYLFRVLLFFFKDKAVFAGMIGDVSPVLDPLIGAVAAVFYIIMFCALGYLIGSFVQLHRIFKFLLPAFAIGLLFLDNWTTFGTPVIGRVIEFYAGETHLVLFMIKTLITAAVMFSAAFFLMGKKEVRT